MKVIIAPDSFKECLTASQVAKHIANGIRSVYPTAEIIGIPIADGGEGTAANYKVPVIALAGIIGQGAEVLLEKGITAYFALADKPMSMEESKENAGQLLGKKTEQVMRVIAI